MLKYVMQKIKANEGVVNIDFLLETKNLLSFGRMYELKTVIIFNKFPDIGKHAIIPIIIRLFL
jgi:hypothetical protein